MEQKDPNSHLLQELEALSQTLYQSHSNRRTASLVIPRSAAPPDAPAPERLRVPERPESRPRRRMSMSPWRSRPKQQESDGYDDGGGHSDRFQPPLKSRPEPAEEAATEEKKGIWNWKPMRALSHITMNRLSCLFSVEVVTVQGLPASMNGLRLSVAVRKKDTKEGAVQTMPARVLQGAADFEETLFVRCHLYCSGGAVTGKPIKFEPRPFLISVLAVDATELDFGRSTVELCSLVKESMEKNLEGTRIRQWEKSFALSGKAKGGELVVKLGFQIMEDSGVGIYSQMETGTKASKSAKSSPAIARKQSKTSFSVTSPRTPNRPEPVYTPSQKTSAVELQDIDDFKLDEPAPPPPLPQLPKPKIKPEVKAAEDLHLPEFEIVDKGVEIQDAEKTEGVTGQDDASDEKLSSNDVIVKEVVVDNTHLKRLTELDSIAAQIMALESMITKDDRDEATKGGPEPNWNVLDAEEETVTREFLQLLELDDSGGGGEDFTFDVPEFGISKSGDVDEGNTKVFVPDLGKGLSTVVQTKDGGYLAAANPFDVEVLRKDTPKLAIQISKPFILKDQRRASGFEVLQRMAAMGSEELAAKLFSMAAMDDLTGKTAEQIAFEGIASAIISGRNKEVASSSAARSVAQLREMAAALSSGRKERVRTGLWNVKEGAVSAELVLASSLQRLESMAVEALKIHADMAEEKAPFDVFTLVGKGDPNPPLESAVVLEEWGGSGKEGLTMVVVAQLRDPMRRYEKVGAPVVGVVQAEGKGDGGFQVGSLHVGGLSGKAWVGENGRTTAAQWLVAYGLGRKGKGGAVGKGEGDVLWSMSSRVVADMWLKPIRNPDVKFPQARLVTWKWIVEMDSLLPQFG